MKDPKKITLTAKDFEKLFEDKITPYVSKKIKEYNLIYSPVTDEERDQCILRIVNTLLDPFLVYSGPHRLKQWEKGWGQNLQEFSEKPTTDSVFPHYHGKYEINRLDQKFVKGISKGYERNMLYVILDYLFDKYLRDAKTVYEFGCGTGHNLLRVREVNPQATLWGLDWATSSQKLIKKMVTEEVDENMKAHRFDYFKPDTKFKLDHDSIIYTVASLEQIGDKHTKFVSYLLKQKPKLCIHVEPIAEVLDENILIDSLSIEYFKKRKYLSGFLTHLQNLEKEGKVTIHEARRTYVGSFYIEGYSVIVWSPK